MLEQECLFDVDGLCFFGIRQVMLGHRLPQQEIDASADHPCFLQIVACEEETIIKTVEETTADLQFFLKLGIGSLSHVRITVVFLVADGIIVHGFL